MEDMQPHKAEACPSYGIAAGDTAVGSSWAGRVA